MLYGHDRSRMRQFYLDAWRKYRTQQEIEPLERLIAEVIALHPEYHSLLQSQTLHKDFEGETNPFLHMSLHIAVREQLSADRPPGVRAIYQQLLLHKRDNHAAEHLMIEVLAESLWQAQQNGTAPDEQRYLARLQQLLNS